MQSLIDSHYLSLPSQGNLFLSVKFQKVDGTTRILVAAIRRKIYLVEYQYMENYIEPVTKEVFFSCIPGIFEVNFSKMYCTPLSLIFYLFFLQPVQKFRQLMF